MAVGACPRAPATDFEPGEAPTLRAHPAFNGPPAPAFNVVWHPIASPPPAFNVDFRLLSVAPPPPAFNVDLHLHSIAPPPPAFNVDLHACRPQENINIDIGGESGGMIFVRECRLSHAGRQQPAHHMEHRMKRMAYISDSAVHEVRAI